MEGGISEVASALEERCNTEDEEGFANTSNDVRGARRILDRCIDVNGDVSIGDGKYED